jgi:hypothetical protein
MLKLLARAVTLVDGLVPLIRGSQTCTKIFYSFNQNTKSCRPARVSLFGWLVADGWCWFCSERRVLLASCWWLVCCERKVLAGG